MMPRCSFHHVAWSGAVLAPLVLAPSAGRADVFDGMRQTFERDIPHFFQDDVPCAFGGQPTSRTRASCSGNETRKHPATKAPVRGAAPARQERR